MANKKIKNLSIDIETYSGTDLSKCGVYKYSEDPAFDILLFGYSADGSDVKIIDIASGEQIPEEIFDALVDETVTKWAHNALFERICLSAWLRKNHPEKFKSHDTSDDTKSNYLDPHGWKCTMVWAGYLGLPLSLKDVGTILDLGEQKLSEGKDLIRYFCAPCKPTKANGGRTRNLPVHEPDKWERFKAYNVRDVEVEAAIQMRLQNFPVPYSIWKEYWIDQTINDRGVAIDKEFVSLAYGMKEQSTSELMEVLKTRTGLDNPNSVAQMKRWLAENGLRLKSLRREDMPQIIKGAPPEIAEVLKLYQGLSKPSLQKYPAMLNAVCADGRIRGMFQFYGAHTGRWTGKTVQLHNLPKNQLNDLEQARDVVCSGDYDALKARYDDVPDVLSQLVRTAFIPREGCKFIVADFSSIEARVLAWLAGETWRIKAFEDGEDIYCTSASKMFGVPVKKDGQNAELRQKGKVAELALGYGGAIGALESMGALEMGLTKSELPTLVAMWRDSNLHITKLWRDVDNAALNAVQLHTDTETADIRFSYQSGMLFITLPSGRRLSYAKPRIGMNRFGSDCVTYEGINKQKKWVRQETYGGRLVENIVQAISRDILAYAMQTLSTRSIVMHVHDELIIEVDPQTSVEEIVKQMEQTPPWGKGLTLRADGYETYFYKKD